jgi:hypothetical protein
MLVEILVSAVLVMAFFPRAPVAVTSCRRHHPFLRRGQSRPDVWLSRRPSISSYLPLPSAACPPHSWLDRDARRAADPTAPTALQSVSRRITVTAPSAGGGDVNATCLAARPRSKASASACPLNVYLENTVAPSLPQGWRRRQQARAPTAAACRLCYASPGIYVAVPSDHNSY